jgi:sugar phosphate isomerase/epimerase
MNNDRRKFLKLSALAASGMAFSLYSCGTGNNAEKAAALLGDNEIKFDFGIQLYSLKEDMAQDPQGVLRKLAEFGYKELESFEGKEGMFWGMGNTGFKSFVEDLGMKMIASHCNINQDFEQKAELAAEIGMKYLICPYVGAQKTLDDYKRLADKFNECGEITKKHGLRFAYHNHEYSFKELEGEIPQIVMMDNTDPALVDYEFDLYWVVTGGSDPEEYFKKYANRIRLCHVKDRKKDAPDGEKGASTELGTGSIDYPSILASAQNYGMLHYIVEQEKFDNSTPLLSAEKNAEYMKKIIAPIITKAATI